MVIPRSEDGTTEIPTRVRDMIEEAEMNESPTKLPTIWWHKWALVCGESERKREEKRRLGCGREKGTGKKRKEEGEEK
jgi:hypothetical protein